ncbi:hypothetical protein ACFYTF_00480 [Nocardia thailandica]|uniref:Uncharacterized protein n=1 Tax=Nocardia thailandica TaxID=257275 RepID=A0ABW6PG50_9NOCA
MDEDGSTPIIRTEAVGHIAHDSIGSDFYSTETTWNLEDAVDAFLCEFDADKSRGDDPAGGEIVVTATLASRSFPSMHFDHRLLSRLAASGKSLRIRTGPRPT